MVTMTDFFDLLKIILPSIVMLVAVVFLVNNFMRDREKRQQVKLRMTNRKVVFPLQLQAYERMILFLERISPDSIVMRANYPDKTGAQLLQELLSTIRAEYEHNLTQQLYVSPQAWESVKNAKNFTISMINAAAAEMEEGAPAIELSRKILAAAAEMPQTPTQKALDELKRDIQQSF
jgi:hypothetical protein